MANSPFVALKNKTPKEWSRKLNPEQMVPLVAKVYLPDNFYLS